MKPFLLLLAFATSAGVAFSAIPSHRPRLLLTPQSVHTIRENVGKYPLYDAVYQQARAQADRALAAPIDVPQPRDAAGETHERHKRNYVEMQLAGFFYQVTGEVRYAHFVRDMLLRYADLYPKLGSHPAGKSSAPGRLFHQTLNEAVWLVNTSQAYDCIHAVLTSDERQRIEENVFRHMVRFFTQDRAEEFDRIHNHGTWAATAVGMAGYALGDERMVKQALYGTRLDGSAGYLRQLDELFGPDGYYCEGPYYARYALLPFFLFAEVVEQNEPELKIFSRRNELLRQAVHAMVQQTAPSGAFIPFNDALKEKDLRSPDAVFAVDATYVRYGRNPEWISVAQRQGTVSLHADGLEMARAIASNPNPPAFPFASVEFHDGAKGTAGGIALLRSGSVAGGSLALLKYTAFGMEHGHYDKLGLIYYDQGREIIPDYGSARFLNVEQKDGGRYLRENQTFAKQTIAHNTVTIDEASAYGGKYDNAEHQHSDRHFFDARDPDFQVASAVDRTAYPGVVMQRTIAMVRDAKLPSPIVLDVYRLKSDRPRRYDYSFYYAGQFLATNVALDKHTTRREPFGARAGYQHLWLTAEGPAQGPVSFTWMNGERYYTITTHAEPAAKLHLVQVGANDPEVNLRPEQGLVLRADQRSSHVFASAIEPHGMWDGVKEQTFGGQPRITSVTVLADTDEGTVVRIKGRGGLEWTLLVANQGAPAGTHRVSVGAETFSWEGNAALRRN